MTDKHDKLELHLGEDYAVAMLPHDTTENAAIMFGCNTEDDFCEEVVKRYNAYLDLEKRIARTIEMLVEGAPTYALQILRGEE